MSWAHLMQTGLEGNMNYSEPNLSSHNPQTLPRPHLNPNIIENLPLPPPQNQTKRPKNPPKIIQSRVPAEMIILFGSYARGT